MPRYRELRTGDTVLESDQVQVWEDAGLMGGYLAWESVPRWRLGYTITEGEGKAYRRPITPFSELTEFDWLQIELAASGCISGTSAEWPALRAAIEKITGKPVGPHRTASWLQGFCEGILIQSNRKGEADDNQNS